MYESPRYSIITRDKHSAYLRRTGDDYGDIRDTFEYIEGYGGHGADPGHGYSGWTTGRKAFSVGKTSLARYHQLITLHHWMHNPQFKNFNPLHVFKRFVPRPMPEDVEYLSEHHRRVGHLPDSIPLTIGYAGFTPLFGNDVGLKIENRRVECRANFLRRLDKVNKAYAHTSFGVTGASGRYVDPIRDLSEREYTWQYSLPLTSKGEYKYTNPLPLNVLYPDQSKLRGRIDINGYGGHMPNMKGKSGGSVNSIQKEGMEEFKLNYFSHLSDVGTPFKCKRYVKPKENLGDGALDDDHDKRTAIDWVNKCPYKTPERAMIAADKEIIRQRSLRPSQQSKKGCSKFPTRKEVYNKVLFEKCPSSFKRNPNYKVPI